MLQRAVEKRDALPPDVRQRVTLHQAPAESLPFPDAAFDCAVSALVLCTVSDQPKAIAELRRVLKPQGVLRLMEHVRAESTAAMTVQRAIQPVWGWTAAGCHLDRPTEASLEAAGFDLQVERRLRPMPILPMFVGEARIRLRL
jgi:SAM-dependent methyltransferase